MDVLEGAALASLVRRGRVLAGAFALIAAVSAGVGGSWPGQFGVPIVLAVLHAWLFRRLSTVRRWGPVGFVVGRRGLASPRPQVPYGSVLIVVSGIVAARIAGGDPGSGPVFFALLAAWHVGGMFRRSALVIGPDGVWLGSRVIPWSVVDRSRLHPPVGRIRTLRIPIVPTVTTIEPEPVDANPTPPAGTPLTGRGLDYDANVNALVAADGAPVAARVTGADEIEVDLTTVTTDPALIVRVLSEQAHDS